MEIITTYLVQTFTLNKIQIFLATIIGIIGSWFGGYTIMVKGLLLALTLDFLLGFLRALFEKKISSKKFTLGLVKILAYCIAIIVLNNVDNIVGLTSGYGFTEFGVTYLGIRESLSCLKHLQSFGVPIPKALIEKLEDYKETIENKKFSS